ncbi:carboxypeptidase-like protein [Mesonia algae]|uniref:Carboxypeptidase-like protein n=1 Tax=Mesonia algae TaxID=213248 RepID=A0A2W7HZY0_9FLAO|nr:carboxypeptidase-like regulatory domain-containing protein [Mesonia algae]PZW38772.1 carboxypeptidase-like protein [Mesonia algae]
MKYTIDIPKPCNEGWQNMTPSQKGRFCASCQKEVIDFTQLSSSDITRKIKSSKNLCGRFTKDQLQQNYTISSHNNLSRLGIALGLGSIIAVAQPSFAQEKRSRQYSVLDFKTHNKKEKQNEENTTQVLKNSAPFCELIKFISINGTVTDNFDLPVPNVSITQQNTSNATQTDLDGNYLIQIPKKDLNEEVSLEFTYIGFDTQKVIINKESKKIDIVLTTNENTLEGFITVQRPNIFQQFLNLFRSKENRRHF